MKFDNVDVISPALFPAEQWNEAEVLGAMTWIWLISANYKNATVSDMARHVLPVIKSRQFALFSRDSSPFAYISWANLDAQSEAEYVKAESWIYSNQNWNCGDRIWLINWFAPLGDSQIVKQLVESKLFENQIFRALYHKGDSRGLKVMTFKGKSKSNFDVKNWIKQHPILAQCIFNN